jgi:L,D-transpeptidase YcbB
MKQLNYTYKATSLSLIMIFFLLFNNISSGQEPGSPVKDERLSSLIKKTISDWKGGSENIDGEQISSVVLVKSFYKGRSYLPAWSEDGRPSQVDSLVKAIEDTYGDGLSPEYYHLTDIKSLADKIMKEAAPDSAQLSDLDILMTDAFLTLGCHLSAGCVNPVTLETKWFLKSLKVDVSSVLEQALKKKQIREALTELRPKKDIYNRLKAALARYRQLSLKTEWPKVSSGPSLKKGMKSNRVAELRKRLESSGDLTAVAGEATSYDFFDEKLEQSVMAFQKRHGFEGDGVVGRKTLDALNVPLMKRVRQMEVNMERMRWILGSQEERFIVVNIADFRLDVMEYDKSVLSMKVVVGKSYQSTPIFAAKMTYIVVNPVWNVPASIARKEILKKIQEDPLYLTKQNIKVVEGPGFQGKQLDPEKIDWLQITASDLTYRFRQAPGPLNPLGTLKFMFPNEYNVYLHDTSTKNLFSRDVRTFSHGCIRIEKPLELAEYLLRDNPGWSVEKLKTAIETGAEQIVKVPRPLNVNFLYLTAWVDEDNIVQFRNDIYGRDASLDKALQRRPTFK